MRTITLEDVYSVLPDLPRERRNPGGGYSYTASDGGHCVAGEILVRLGAPVPTADEPRPDYLLTHPNRTIINGLDRWYAERDVVLAPDAVRVLQRLQSFADGGGNTWGEALEAAGL